MTRYTTILLGAILSLSIACSTAFAGGATTVYDFIDHYPDARVSNALSSATRMAKSGGIEARSLFLHPMGSGDAVAEYTVSLPKVDSGEKLLLVYSAGLDDGVKRDDSARPFDGVTFQLKVNGDKQFSADLKDPCWVSRAADLTSKAGKKVKVAFTTRCNNNTNYDWALWAAPQVHRLPKDALTTGVNDLAKGIVITKPSSDAVLTVAPQGGSAKPITVNLSKGDYGSTRFDFTASGAKSVKIDYSGNAREVAVYSFAPSLEISAFGPTHAIVYQGKEATLRAIVKNIGEGPLKESDGASVQFGQSVTNGNGEPLVLGDTALVVIGKLPVGAMLPGESKTVEYKFTPPANTAEVVLGALAVVDGSAVSTVTKSVQPVVSPMDPGKAVTSVAAKTLSDGSAVLQNPKLRVQFLKSSAGFAAWTMSIPKGTGWEQVASGPFGRLVAGADADEAAEYGLCPTEVKTAADSVTFVSEQKIGKSPCTFEWTFKLDARQPRLSVSQSVKADKSVDILHFSGPTVYAGDGSFGARKDEGLFPGLEYLLTEQSSGTEFVSPPKNLRTVPHPNKITIPFMAVRNGGTLVMLEWDPLQKWAPGADRPAAVFASSNFVDAQDNHLMGIFAPSVPDYMAENTLVAEKPFDLAAGQSIRLDATITVKTDSTTVLDAVDEWIAEHGLPQPPTMDSKPAQMMALCDQAFLGPTWDPTAKAWKHTNTGPVFFDPMIADYLLTRDNRVYDEATSEKIQSVLRPAIEKAKDTLPLSTALLSGGVIQALDRQYKQIEGIIGSQREDGSWAYTPDKEHEVFGKPGNTSSGWTALRAQQVLEHALMTGDPKAREAGLKALKYLDTTVRPEGAQTWELQLHVPDILASAYLVRSYLAGYRLTDDQHYLDRAVYWAKSGLPFVYLWNAEDRPIMRYGTIPVLGSTWFDKQAWFGVMVQWCGLEYGYSIDKLADFDKTLPWKQIAKGILYCGIQQQEYITKEYPTDVGMYPDAYSPVKGKEEYHWDLNPRLIARNLLRDLGVDGEPSTYVIRDRRGQMLGITVPVQGGKISYKQEWLNLDMDYSVGSTIYAVMAGVYKPESIGLNEDTIGWISDIDYYNRQGWQYDENRTISFLKLHPRTNNHIVVDLIEHEIRPLPGEEQPKPPAPEPAK